MSIPEISEWLKTHKREVVLFILFFLVSSISFALGYLAASDLKRVPIIIEKASDATASASDQVQVAQKPKIPAKAKSAAVAPQPTAAPELQVVATVIHSDPIPQPTVAATPTVAAVSITEVMAGSSASGDEEFIELYNSNSVAVDLTGYSIKKRSSSGSETSLVSASRFNNKYIPGGKHFLIVHDGATLAPYADVLWPGSYSLAYTNNAVVLYDANDAKVSEVTWIKLSPSQSTTGTPTPENSAQ